MAAACSQRTFLSKTSGDSSYTGGPAVSKQAGQEAEVVASPGRRGRWTRSLPAGYNLRRRDDFPLDEDRAAMIEEFYVNNYKCLVDVRLPLTPMHVIIGQNDSGKTSLLEAMLALSRSTERPLAEHSPASGRIANWCMPARRNPSSSSRSASVPTEGRLTRQLTYHLEVEFGSGRSCRRIDEWFENADRIPITERSSRLDGGWPPSRSETRRFAGPSRFDRRAVRAREPLSLRPSVNGDPGRDRSEAEVSHGPRRIRPGDAARRHPRLRPRAIPRTAPRFLRVLPAVP